MQDTKALGPSNDRIPRSEMDYARTIAKVAARNQAFAQQSPDRQRVTIARDVLKWLREGKVVATPNVYLDEIKGSDNDYTVDGGSCKACALGATLACAAERSIFTPYKPLLRMMRSEMQDELLPYFTRGQLDEIETAFEMSTATGHGSDAAKAYGQRIAPNYSTGGRHRLTAIMKNIIRNHGTFVPTDTE